MSPIELVSPGVRLERANTSPIGLEDPGVRLERANISPGDLEDPSEPEENKYAGMEEGENGAKDVVKTRQKNGEIRTREGKQANERGETGDPSQAVP